MGHRKDREAEACGGGFSVTAEFTPTVMMMIPGNLSKTNGQNKPELGIPNYLQFILNLAVWLSSGGSCLSTSLTAGSVYLPDLSRERESEDP